MHYTRVRGQRREQTLHTQACTRTCLSHGWCYQPSLITSPLFSFIRYFNKHFVESQHGDRSMMMSTLFVDNSVWSVFFCAVACASRRSEQTANARDLNMISRFNIAGVNIRDNNEVIPAPFEDQQTFESLEITATPVTPNTVENPEGSTQVDYKKAACLANMVVLWLDHQTEKGRN